MSWSTELDELLDTTVVVYPSTSISFYGVRGFSTGGSTYQARYVRKAERVRTANGQVIEQSGIVWVASTTALSTTSRVRITGTTGEAPPILAVDRFPDEDGLHHQRLRLGW